MRTRWRRPPEQGVTAPGAVVWTQAVLLVQFNDRRSLDGNETWLHQTFPCATLINPLRRVLFTGSTTMAEIFTLGSDEGRIPSLPLECLSHYPNNGNDYVDLTLSEESYIILKEHFRKVLEEELYR